MAERVQVEKTKTERTTDETTSDVKGLSEERQAEVDEKLDSLDDLLDEIDDLLSDEATVNAAINYRQQGGQ